MKRILYTLLGLAFIAGCFYLFLQNPVSTAKISSVTIGNTTIQVEVADTEALRDHGLSDRDALPVGTGMLFVFDTPGKYGFWMKDMRFPIDIVWISESGEVAGIERSAQPNSYPEVFYPSTPVKYVLETAADSPIDIGSHASFR